MKTALHDSLFLTRFARCRLAQAISLILAGVFSLRVLEAEAEDSSVESSQSSLDLPSEAGALLYDRYTDIAVQAAEDAPRLFAARAMLGAPPPVNITTVNGVGVRATAGVVSVIDQVTVNNAALTTAPAQGQTGLQAQGSGQISGTGVTVNLVPKTAASALITASNMTGVNAESGGHVALNNSTITLGGGVGGQNNRALVASDADSRIDFAGGEVSTLSKGSIGVLAQNGGKVVLSQGATISTSGAASTSTASHGLKASGIDSRIEADAITVNTSGASSSGARAEDGASMSITNSTFNATNAASSTATTAVMHALGGSDIQARGVNINATGTYVGGVRAEGSASQVGLSDSAVDVKGSGNALNYASAVRAMAGAQVNVDNSNLSAAGTFSHGVSVEDSGSQGKVAGTRISVGGARSYGVYVNGGAQAEVDHSRIDLTPAAGAVGPWGLGALVEGSGSRLLINDSEVHTTQKTSYGVRALSGAELEINNGLIDTLGDYSAGLAAANSSVIARNLTITTAGNDNAMGVVADAGSTITLYGGSVTTTGNGSPISSNLTFPHALVSRNPGALLTAYGTSAVTTGTQAYGAAVDDGGSMVLNDLAVKTLGNNSIGLYAGIGTLKPGAVSLVANHVAVQTQGDHAAGALTSRRYNSETATLALNNSTISTQGLQSHGLQAESGAALTAVNTAVSTGGDAALGALANNTATVALDNVNLVTQGDAAHGMVAKNGGSLTANGAAVNASGDYASALYAQGTDALKGQASVSNSVLHNRNGATIAVAGVADISLKDAIAGGSGQWLNVDSALDNPGTSIPDMGTGQWQGVGQSFAAAGKATLDVAGSVVSGSALTAAGSSADVTLRDTSIWKLTGESNLSNLNNDFSLIDFSAPVGGNFKNLTVNNYHGTNGTIALNTYLYKDDSPSDKLVVDNGKADGSSNLQINNAGGPGALTQGNGIMVVDAINGATTGRNAFRLLSQVKAGPYEYTLHRASLDASNGEAWYLRSTKDAVPVDPVVPVVPVDPLDPVSPADPQTPVQPRAPLAPQVPNYRAETSLYRAIPSMVLHYSHAMVDTLHERVGEERRLSTDPLPSEEVDSYGPSLGWGRLIYRKGEDDLGQGARYDYNIQAFQVGSDLYRNDDIDGSTDQAGLSLQVGRVKGNVDHTDGTDAGSDLLRSYGVGAYWTHFGPEGWYLDGVLQFNRFDIKAGPNAMDSMKTRGRGVTASLEAGYPFHAEKDKDLHVEPQAQIIASRVRIDDAHDDAADVQFEDVDSLTGRLGVRIDKDWFRQDDDGKIHRTNAWVRPSVWHEFKGKAKTEFSSADGYIPFGTDMSGTWGEVNVGVDYQVNKRTTVTGSLGYQKAFGEDSRSYEGMIGIKVNF